MENIYALTPPDSPYPPYISINEMPDKSISITVRTEAKDGTCGNVGMVVITREEFCSLIRDSAGYIARRVRLEMEAEEANKPKGVA